MVFARCERSKVPRIELLGDDISHDGSLDGNSGGFNSYRHIAAGIVRGSRSSLELDH